MNQSTLPIPNPDAWCTGAHAARMLGVTRQTINRMRLTGRLTQYHTRGGMPMFWVAEVEQLRDARKRAGRV